MRHGRVTVRAAFFAVALVLSLYTAAFSQSVSQSKDKPMSPPDRTPVPLTDTDQERARSVETVRKDAKPVTESPKIKIPGRHISSGNALLDAFVYDAAARYSLDPCLIISVMNAESAFNTQAISPKGARGLMQLMPATAARFGVKNIFDARENVAGGASYLRFLLDRFGGDVPLALAGYNAGEGAVEFYGNRIPPFLETQSYVRVIYARYSRIHSAGSVETSLPEPVQAKTGPAEVIPTYNQIIRSTSSTGDNSNKP